MTEALLRNWKPSFDKVWEPACGDGAISKVLSSHGYTVLSTDLVDRGHGIGGIDFLATDKRQANCIITNPPFKLAAKFIEHAFDIGVVEMALVLKATYWHAATRLPLFQKHPPSIVMPMTWRPDFLNKGAPTMDCMWRVWDLNGQGTTRYVPITKG